MKTCSSCKVSKPENEFGKNAARKDGLHNECKICKNTGNSKYYKTEKARVTLRRWREKNKEKIYLWRNKYKEYDKEYREKNKEKIREYSRLARQKNPTYRLDWQRKNVDKVRANKSAYRARKAGNGGSFTSGEWKNLCEKYDNKCLCCGKETKLTADHIIPVTRGGTSNIDNIQPLCRSCNSAKHTKEIDYRISYNKMI